MIRETWGREIAIVGANEKRIRAAFVSLALRDVWREEKNREPSADAALRKVFATCDCNHIVKY